MFGLSSRVVLGIVITLIALLMGATFTFFNVTRSKGPRERRFVIRGCVLAWTLMAVCLLLTALVPRPYRYISLGVLTILFPVLIYRLSIRHQLMRELERRELNIEENNSGREHHSAEG